MNGHSGGDSDGQGACACGRGIYGNSVWFHSILLKSKTSLETNYIKTSKFFQESRGDQGWKKDFLVIKTTNLEGFFNGKQIYLIVKKN
jgi:hypothetical protein